MFIFLCPQSNQNQQDPMLLKVINLTAIAIRRLIKMSKKISAFKNMCQEDQLALLKAGSTEMMILRSAMQYDCDRASWKVGNLVAYIPHSVQFRTIISVHCRFPTARRRCPTSGRTCSSWPRGTSTRSTNNSYVPSTKSGVPMRTSF